jgi:hypothetical protein
VATFVADAVSLRADIDPANGFVTYEVVMSGQNDAGEYVEYEPYRHCGGNHEKALALFQLLTSELVADDSAYGFQCGVVDGQWMVLSA